MSGYHKTFKFTFAITVILSCFRDSQCASAVVCCIARC